MPYAARNEMTTAIDLAIDDALAKEGATGTRQYVHPQRSLSLRALTSGCAPCPASEISEDAIAAQLMTARAGSPPLDLLVRTSGVRRLSDFLLWQVRAVSPLLAPPAPISPPRFWLSSPRLTERTNAPGHAVLRGHAAAVQPDVLARLWVVGLCAHRARLPAQSVGRAGRMTPLLGRLGCIVERL